MNEDNRRVRRIVETPNGRYVSKWYEQHAPYGHNVMLNYSAHPQDSIFITVYRDSSIGIDSIEVVKTLPIAIELENGNWVTISPSIVEQSIITCEFENTEYQLDD